MADQAPPTVRITCREYLGWRFGVDVPYLTLLTDLASVNAGRPFPRLPQTYVQAAVKVASQRRRRPGVPVRVLTADGKPWRAA